MALSDSKKFTRKDGVLYSDGLPVDLVEVEKRERAEVVEAAIAARSYSNGQVVLLAIKVVDARDPQHIVLQVVGEGDDTFLRMSKRGLVAAENLGKEIVEGDAEPPAPVVQPKKEHEQQS